MAARIDAWVGRRRGNEFVRSMEKRSNWRRRRNRINPSIRQGTALRHFLSIQSPHTIRSTGSHHRWSLAMLCTQVRRSSQSARTAVKQISWQGRHLECSQKWFLPFHFALQMNGNGEKELTPEQAQSPTTTSSKIKTQVHLQHPPKSSDRRFCMCYQTAVRANDSPIPIHLKLTFISLKYPPPKWLLQCNLWQTPTILHIYWVPATMRKKPGCRAFPSRTKPSTEHATLFHKLRLASRWQRGCWGGKKRWFWAGEKEGGKEGAERETVQSQ